MGVELGEENSPWIHQRRDQPIIFKVEPRRARSKYLDQGKLRSLTIPRLCPISLSTETPCLVPEMHGSAKSRTPKDNPYLTSELNLIYEPWRTPAFTFADS
jgi:hypothetical protein